MLVAIVQLLLSLNLLTREALPDEIGDQNHHHQHQRGGPGQFHLVLEGHAGEVVDQHRQAMRSAACRLRCPWLSEPVVAEQCGEKQEVRFLPRPARTASMTPVRMPGIAVGSRTIQTVWVVVAPMPMAASFILEGTMRDRVFGGQA